MNKKLEEKDFDIVPRLMKIRSFIFFSKEIQVYDIIPRKGFWKSGEITPIATGIYSFEDAIIFLRNYIKYYNAPKYIIEKNGLGKYRYRKKSRFSVDSYYTPSEDFDVYYDPPIHSGQIFSSIEEIKRHLLKIESENKWETIEEIYE
jgi:hypothetical protein